MHIYIIAQHMIFSGQDEDTLYTLGKEYVDWGHEVTVFTTAAPKIIDFKGKKIGLLHEKGINFVLFNMHATGKILAKCDWWKALKFARMTGRQGRKLPRPDIIFALSTPLVALLPALSLSSEYAVPLVTEIRKIWPNGTVQPNLTGNSVIFKAKQRILEKAYKQSDHIIAGEKEIAEAVKTELSDSERNKKVSILPRDLQGKELIDFYDRVIAGLLKNKD